MCSRRGTPCSNCKAGNCQYVPSNVLNVNHDPAADEQTLTPDSLPAGTPSPPDINSDTLPPLPAFTPASNEYVWGNRPASEMTPIIESAFREVMHWRPNLFVPPSCNPANDVIAELSTLLKKFVEKTGFERVALTAFFLLPHLVLQLPGCRRSAAKRRAMERRLSMWRAGDIEELLVEGRALQQRLRGGQQQNDWQRGFVRLMLVGRSTAAMRMLRSGSTGGVLSLDEQVEEKTVRDILREKHPEPAPVNLDYLATTPLPGSQQGHAVLFESVDGAAIVKAALNTQGGAGPSGLDANAWRQLITGYRPSKHLADTLAGFSRRLCTEYVDPASTFAFTCCRLVPLDKNPGVRPIGIGEVVRRIVGKTALQIIRPDLKRAAGTEQLCVGQRAGIESAIHELRSSFNASPEQCLLQVDADNAFNSLNRSLALRNIGMTCPLLKELLINCYRERSYLPICDDLFYSQEGLTQGDNLAMAAFGANTLPLISRIKDHLPSSVLQKWYADDANATGELSDLRQFYDLLTSFGPNYGYHINPSKCWLVVSPGKLQDARSAFVGLPINITEEGHQLLGSAIGTETFMHSFISSRVADFETSLNKLTEIASDEPHIAYCAFVHCLQGQWLHLLRTTPLADGALESVDQAIQFRFLPILLRRSVVNDLDREWFALPVQEGGLGIRTWSDEDHTTEYQASQKICRPLSEDTESDERELQQERIAGEIRRERIRRRKARVEALHSKLNATQQHAREIAKEKGASSWLNTRPLETQGYHLSATEFRDAVAMRMGWTPADLPKVCHCGVQFTISHALSCPLGGFPTIRHNETRDLLADVMTEACNSVAIEPTLTPAEGRAFTCRSTTTDNNARVDIVAGGVWGGRFERAFFDVCVFNAFAPSNAAKPLLSAYEYHERRKIAKYAERVREVEHGSFIPLVFSSSGGCGPITTKTVKRLAFLLSEKRKVSYADAINWLRRRISFSLLRASSQCFRGARSKLHSPQRPSGTCIQATNAISVPRFI